MIEVLTAVLANGMGAIGDLIPKSHERSFATCPIGLIVGSALLRRPPERQ